MNVIVLEDEERWQLSLEKYLNSLGHNVVAIHEQTSKKQIIEDIRKFNPDLFIVDMHLKNTLDKTLESTYEIGRRRIPFIILTQHKAYYDETYGSTYPFSSYILKGSYQNDPEFILKEAIDTICVKTPTIIIRERRILVENILWIYKSREEGYILLTTGEIVFCTLPLNDFIDTGNYSCPCFFRINGNYVVNVRKIERTQRIEKRQIKLLLDKNILENLADINTEELVVGANKIAAFMKHWQNCS